MLRTFASFFMAYLLCSAAFMHTANATGIVSTPNTIILAPGPIHIKLNESIQWLKAEYQTLSLGQLQAQPDAPFENLKQGAVLESKNVYWLRMRVLNSFDDHIQLALSLAPKNITIEAAYSKTNGQWAYLTQIKANSLLTAHSSLMLGFKEHSDSWVYLRIKAASTTKLDAQLQDMNHYAEDLIFYQQLIGASISTAVFIIVLHILILQFHLHMRHYLIIFMSIISALFISSHSPSELMPNWATSLNSLSLWLIACTLLLSSFSSSFYRENLYSNRSFFIVLFLMLLSLILINAADFTLIFLSLIPTLWATLNAVKEKLFMLLIACLIFAISNGWQLLYLSFPNTIWHPFNMLEVYTVVSTITFTSISTVIPYFKRQSLQKASNNQNSYSGFLSSLSHSFRTPMNGVLGMSELLKDTPLSQQQRDYLSTIEQSGHDLLRLINRVSDLGKIQKGKLQRNNQDFDLTIAIEKIIEKHVPLAEQNHVEMIVNIHSSVPNNITCDEERLFTILDNLILSALSNTEHGEVEIKAYWLNEATQDQLLFTVRDSGSGIPKHIFQKILSNHSLSNRSAVDIQDINFGLLLSKYIIEALDGEFYIESNSNIGTSIRFTIGATSPSFSKTVPLSNSLSGLSILVVDDNSTFRTVIQQYAQNWGAHADTTYNGKEALALLRNHNNTDNPYDIILIDQAMPIMDGFQLAAKIKNDPEINQNIIKIMLTGSGVTSQSKLVADTGIQQVIAKPVTSRALQAALIQHITQNK